jgi:tetratricopeptide (TPR) repeat protein
LVTLATLAFSTLLAVGALSADVSRVTELVRKAGDYYKQGLNQQGEKAADEALSILDNSRGSQDPAAAASLNDLAALAYAQGDLEKAEQLFQRSRAAWQALAGPDDLRLATTLYNLGGVHLEQGRYEEAETLLRSSLEIREKPLGPGHPLVAEVWNNLGFLYLHQRKYGEAASWLEKALAVWEKSTSDAAYGAVALNNLAVLRRLQGDFATAESLYKRALSADEKAFGQDHPETASALASLAALYRACGMRGQAVETYERALEVLEKTVGAQDPLAIETRGQLSELTADIEGQGEYQILVMPSREDADQMRRRIEKGEDMAELAARHSIDPHASNGGRFRARASDLRDELRAQLSRLGMGQVSGVFPLAGNWAIVRKISEPTSTRE